MAKAPSTAVLVNRLRDAHKEHQKKSQSKKRTFLKIDPGKNIFRIFLPNDEALETLGLPVLRHKGGRFGYGLADDVFYLNCPKENKGERCPICELREWLEKEGEEEVAKKLFPQARNYFAAVKYSVDERGKKMDKPKPEVGLLEVAPATADQIVLEIIDALEQGVRLYDPKKGYDFHIFKTGKGTQTRYKVTRALAPSKDVIAMKAKFPDPSEMLSCLSYMEMLEKLSEELQVWFAEAEIEPPDEDADTDETGDDADTGEEPEDEEEEEPEEEEEDEEEEPEEEEKQKPAPKKRKKAPKKKEPEPEESEDEETPEDSDEDTEDEGGKGEEQKDLPKPKKRISSGSGEKKENLRDRIRNIRNRK